VIDPAAEHLVSLTRACRHFPRRRKGKRPHVSCLYRWTTVGCRGVVLDSVQVGGTRCTSREAIARFIAALSASQAAAARAPDAQDKRPRDAAEQADDDLKRWGF
jgi:hypothetical protein